MCGIAGSYWCEGAPRGDRSIERMLRVLRHRGPDHLGTYDDDQVSIGYVRLSILDLSPAGNQPMEDDSGAFRIVYNGEVYNYVELRSELEKCGVRFRSGTDTEVVVNWFARFGIEGLKRLNGMFAFAVWNKDTRKLWLARDQLGIKPLYYAVTPREIRFASELKAIMAVDEGCREIDPVGLENYLTFGHSMAPVTMIGGIKKLMPGTVLEASKRGVRTISYFKLAMASPDSGSGRPEGEWVAEGRARLETAVRRQMVADVPVGVLLSGGIDSSLVTALMANAGGKVETFTAKYPHDHFHYDESTAARAVAQRFGTSHHEVDVTAADCLKSLATLAYHYDEPFADAACLPSYLVFRDARRVVKVVLTGEGADELFGGYRRYSIERIGSLWNATPAFVRWLCIQAASQFRPGGRVNRLTKALSVRDPAQRYTTWLQVFSRDRLEWLIDCNSGVHPGGHDGTEVYRKLFSECNGSGVVNRLCYTDTLTWLPDTYLEKVDKASMAVSLEARVPFLDAEMVDFAMRCPSALKVRRFTTKYLLKKIAASMLPASIIRRPKHGLEVPIDRWLRGPLHGYLQSVLLDRSSLERGLYKESAIETLISLHTSGDENCGSQLWTLLMFELWARAVLDRQVCYSINE